MSIGGSSCKNDMSNEQYFFDELTVTAVCDILERFGSQCVLCAPTVGAELERRGARVLTLDIDERFCALRSFRKWDLYRPERIETKFHVIFCDPPFFNASLSQLFNAMRILAQFDLSQKMAMSYLKRRAAVVLGTFAPFGLKPTGFCPAYRTVQKCERNDIEVYANFEFAGECDD